MMKQKILSLLLVVILLIAVFAGCKSREEGGESGSVSSSSASSSSSSKPAEPNTVASATPDLLEDVKEKKALNPDTVGWLHIPYLDLPIDDVVVWKENDNKYYYRKNFDQQDEFNGVLYADKTCTFGDGSIDSLATNTCIYGHAMIDDAEQDKYSIFFGPLHSFRDPEIAKHNPYLYFSTEKENLAFEVFAVFTANIHNAELPYNNNRLTGAEFAKMVREQVLPHSIYNYDVEIKDDDKFLTLSTCIYTLPNGTAVGYPNNYRYAIMGRLVNPDEPIKDEAVFTINEDVIYDPAGNM